MERAERKEKSYICQLYLHGLQYLTILLQTNKHSYTLCLFMPACLPACLFLLACLSFLSSFYWQQRSAAKVKKYLAALEEQLASHHSMFPRGEHYIAGVNYSIADLAIWPWLWALFEVYDDIVPHVFGGFEAYPNVLAYKDRCLARPASRKALEICMLGDN